MKREKVKNRVDFQNKKVNGTFKNILNRWRKNTQFSYNTGVSIISFDTHVSCFTQIFIMCLLHDASIWRRPKTFQYYFRACHKKNPPKSEHSRRAAGRRFASKCSQGEFKNFFKLNIKLQVVFTLHRSDVSSTQNHAHEQRVNKADLSSMLK